MHGRSFLLAVVLIPLSHPEALHLELLVGQQLGGHHHRVARHHAVGDNRSIVSWEGKQNKLDHSLKKHKTASSNATK